MRRRATVALALGAALAATAATIGGCGGGDTIALTAPGAATEWPFDPHWRQLSPLAGNATLRAVDWIPGPDDDPGQAVIVGDGGVALGLSDDRWRLESTGLTVDLLDVVLDDHGVAVAVGLAGAAARRTPHGWRPEETGCATTLRRVVAVPGGAYAAGDAGRVLRRDGGGWRDVSPPTGADLYGLAVRDGVLHVGGADGAVWILADGAWDRRPDGPWAGHAVHGMAVTEAGDLFVAADSLYVQDGAGWRTVAGSGAFLSLEPNSRLVAGGDRLHLVTGWGILACDPYAAAPGFDYVADGDDLAAAGDDLLNLAGRSIRWRHDGLWRTDAAGELSGDWCDLAGGGGVLISSTGTYLPTTDGLVEFLPVQDTRIDGVRITFLADVGPDDLLAMAGGTSIHRRTGAGWEPVAGPFPSMTFSGLDRDGRGRLVAATRTGLGRWTGGDWQWVLGVPPAIDDFHFDRFHLRRGAAGDLLAWSENGAVYRERDGDWFSVFAADDIDAVAQDARGRIAIFGLSRTLNGYTARIVVLVTPGAGQVRVFGDEGLGALQGRDVEGATDQGGEILVWTDGPSMVYRLAGVSDALDWELVAGPLTEQIDDLVVLADGTLVAHGRRDTIHIHRAR